jgi:hypothetical protein
MASDRGRRLPIPLLAALIIFVVIVVSLVVIALSAIATVVPGVLTVPVAAAMFPHALAVALDEALLAVARPVALVFSGSGHRVDVRRSRGFAAWAVALVRGGAGFPFRIVDEAAALAGVIDLHCTSVFVTGDEDVAGEEVGVLAVGACGDQT